MKLDLILENVRNKYNLGLLEESEGLDEKAILQGKILINESTMAIRSMLVEEGVLENTKMYLEEAWTDAVMQAADDTYEGAADTADHVAGGAQGLAHGVAGVGGVAYGDIKDGSFDAQYSKAPKFIGDMTKAGYEAGYNPDLNIADTAKTAAWMGENPGKATALAAGTLAAGGAAVGAGTYYGGPKIVKGVRAAGQFADGAKYGMKNPNQAQYGGFPKAKQAGVKVGQPISKLAGKVRTRFTR